MIDEVAPEKNVARIFLWGAVMLACAVVALLGNITANRMASKVARDTTESMRFDLFDKTLNLSARQTDGFAMPSLVSRLSSDTYNVHNMIGMIQRLGIRAPMLLIGGMFVTFIGRTRAGAGFAGDSHFLVLLAVLVAKKGLLSIPNAKNSGYHGAQNSRHLQRNKGNKGVIPHGIRKKEL